MLSLFLFVLLHESYIQENILLWLELSTENYNLLPKRNFLKWILLECISPSFDNITFLLLFVHGHVEFTWWKLFLCLGPISIGQFKRLLEMSAGNLSATVEDVLLSMFLSIYFCICLLLFFSFALLSIFTHLIQNQNPKLFMLNVLEKSGIHGTQLNINKTIHSKPITFIELNGNLKQLHINRGKYNTTHSFPIYSI